MVLAKLPAREKKKKKRPFPGPIQFFSAKIVTNTIDTHNIHKTTVSSAETY